MPLVRMLVSWGPASYEVRDRFSNTLYFNVSGSTEEPNYQALANDLRDIYGGQVWTSGAKIEVRAYNMEDAKPRPERAFSTVTVGGSWRATANQIAIALSYYADRNLPTRRGRIYLGPQTATTTLIPALTRDAYISFGQALAGLGGLNVDWSVYSPTSQIRGGEYHWRISNIWVDDSWDVIRSRKSKSTARTTATING